MSRPFRHDVSVAVPARNGERELPRLLAALDAQTLGRARFEIVVADDGSSDGTAALVERHPHATLVSDPGARGVAAARALAVSRTTGAVVAITDVDCEPTQRWLEQGLLDMEELGVDLLGGRVDISLDDGPTIPSLIDLARHLDQERAVNQAGYAVTANLFVRRRVLDDIGSFTPGLRAGSDVEWVLRATAAGHRLGYSAHAAVRHPPRSTARALVRKAYRNGYGTGQWSFRARGQLRHHAAAWRAPASYRPRRDIAASDRIRAAGYRLPQRRRWALDAAHYALIQAPFVIGSAVATLRRGRP